jgi:hypothetical protein
MRKETTFVAEDGRDKGKQFHLKEMPASQAEAWAIRALLAIGNAGVEIPDDAAGLGMAGVAAMGIKALMAIPYAAAEPLLDEMMACVQAMPSANVFRPLVEDDIEEVVTRFKLRKAVWELHAGFFDSGGASTLGSSPQPPGQSAARSPISIPRKR